MTMTSIQTARRRFLTGAGIVSFGILASGGVTVFRGNASAQGADASRISDWVSISLNDAMVIRFGAAEMGQGVNTSLPMIFAEEMDADWSKVSVEQVNSDPNRVYGNPGFGGNLFSAGSSSLEGYFDHLRHAGATARRILIYSAAAHWGVEIGEVSTAPGIVIHATSGRRMTFGEIAAMPDLVTDIPRITDADLKPSAKWRIMGTDLPRADIPAKTRGEAMYSIDIRVPDMLHAAQLLAPVEGETPTTVSYLAARGVANVFDVVPLANSVAVLAETFEAALEARDLLKVSWSETSPYRNADSERELEDLVEAVNDDAFKHVVWENKGDISELLRDDTEVHTSQFVTEHVYHAQMEPLNAVANVDADGMGAEIWLGSQSQTISINIAASVLGTTADRIRFHAMQMGGGFGRRTVFARDLLRDALLLSRHAKRPVKLTWTREDDVKNGWLRPATAHRLDAALDDNGDIVAMRHRVAAPSIMKYAFPNRWDPDLSRDLLVMEGSESTDYAIPNMRAEHALVPRKSRVAAWRGIGWGPNCFARECFLDELVHHAGSDPVSFRRRLLRNSPRGIGVLDKVVEMSNFGDAPEGRALGLSFAGYKATFGAGVAEVSIGGGGFRVHRFWAAVDPGIVVHPQNYVAQVEGGIIFGISGLKNERTSFSNGIIEQNNFYDYEVLGIRDVPEIEIRLIESGAAPSGAGEIGVPMTGAAVANAIRALTGSAPKQMPFGANWS